MLNYRITFDSPWHLLLLLLVLVMWFWTFRALAALGPVRRVAALGLRSVVLALFVFALADVQMVRTSDRLTVIYLLDQSWSIPQEARRAMIQYVNAEIKRHRRQQDRAGVIVFGRDAAIEIPPFDDDLQMAPLVESQLDPESTNLAGAMRLAQASFPEDAARRIVVVTDGNENLGSAREEAQALTAASVGIDVVPVRYRRRGEVLLERLAIPDDIRRGQPFDLRVVATNTTQPTPGDPGTVLGKLVVRQWVGDQSEVISEEPVELPPGKRVYSVRQNIDQPGFYTYEALFLPDRNEDDAMSKNNRATAFTQIRGRGQVLLIEDAENKGEYDRLAQALERENLEVTRWASDRLFASLAELQQFDTIVLANVPREHFTDAQIQMLARNTQQMGAGLVMLGATNSFGAGGWANTEVEKAMPVDFQIKSPKVVPTGALAMVMHASEMGQGNYWQKQIAEEALKALGPRDYCGVIHYDNIASTTWLWNPGLAQVGPNRDLMLARLSRMAPGDMPDFDPGLILAQREFAGLTDAAVKHMIVISDGDPTKPSPGVTSALKDLNVTVSTVAVGTHGPAGSTLLKDLATSTGGKYYPVSSGSALPKIFQREARRVAQPLIYENPAGFRPEIRFPHEMTRGIEGPLPPLTGYVLTTRKRNPLVEVSLFAPQPGAEENRTILASWTYGLGKAASFTTDVGRRYATQWTAWESYDKLFGQMVVWSMRPGEDEGKFTVATDFQDNQVRVVVTALDKNDEFLNFLDMSGTVVGPELETIELKMEQVAPGRYVGTFPGTAAGSYFIMISPGPGRAPLRTGINVPYSDEFRAKDTNEALLGQLAKTAPKDGSPGLLIDAPDGLNQIEPLLAVDTFRHDLPRAASSQDVWHYMVLVAGCLFFFDVFVRRVHVGFAWVPALAGRVRDRLRGRQRESTEVATIERLRSRKAEVVTQVEQLRASTRFETAAGPPADLQEIEQPTAKPPAAQPSLAPEKQGESYTERLLKAKQKAWEERK